MPTQTKTQRKVAGTKAAATRKRTTTKASAARTRASARRTSRSAGETVSSARSTTRAAGGTLRQVFRTAERGADAGSTRLTAVARQAERALLIPVGAVLEAKDAVQQNVRVYTDRRSATTRLRRFERRGERALRRNRRSLEQRVRTLL